VLHRITFWRIFDGLFSVKTIVFMKNYRNVIFVILIISCTFTACLKTADTSNPVSPNSTVREIIAKASGLSIWNSAIARTSLDASLAGAGPFTVFVSTDDACSASGLTASYLNGLSADKLDTFLNYSILNSAYNASSFPAGPNAPIHTASGDSVFVTSNVNGVFVNGIPITQADVTGSNGVIHALYTPLAPPAGNLLDLVNADTAFTFLQAAVAKISLTNNSIKRLLTDSGIHTLFAPTNAAFRSAGYLTIDSVTGVNPDSLFNLITYHMVNRRYFSSDFIQNDSLITQNGEAIIIASDGFADVKGKNNLLVAHIISGNVLARNGVLHRIDGLLLP
jgi:uncharacterized surface protein with fasciclin (FAS1) repeats